MTSKPAEQSVFLTEADEINRKVNAMLAATEALKPPSIPYNSPGKTSRITAKISNAWDRLQSRNEIQGKLARFIPITES